GPSAQLSTKPHARGGWASSGNRRSMHPGSRAKTPTAKNTREVRQLMRHRDREKSRIRPHPYGVRRRATIPTWPCVVAEFSPAAVPRRLESHEFSYGGQPRDSDFGRASLLQIPCVERRSGNLGSNSRVRSEEGREPVRMERQRPRTGEVESVWNESRIDVRVRRGGGRGRARRRRGRDGLRP